MSPFPRRSKLTVGTENHKLNHRVIFDAMFFESKAFIHMVDYVTHLPAGAFLKSLCAYEIWKAILRL